MGFGFAEGCGDGGWGGWGGVWGAGILCDVYWWGGTGGRGGLVWRGVRGSWRGVWRGSLVGFMADCWGEEGYVGLGRGLWADWWRGRLGLLGGAGVEGYGVVLWFCGGVVLGADRMADGGPRRALAGQ